MSVPRPSASWNTVTSRSLLTPPRTRVSGTCASPPADTTRIVCVVLSPAAWLKRATTNDVAPSAPSASNSGVDVVRPRAVAHASTSRGDPTTPTSTGASVVLWLVEPAISNVASAGAPGHPARAPIGGKMRGAVASSSDSNHASDVRSSAEPSAAGITSATSPASPAKRRLVHIVVREGDSAIAMRCSTG